MADTSEARGGTIAGGIIGIGGGAPNGAADLAKVQTPSDIDVTGRTEIKWTAERVALIKKQVCPKGATDDDFAIFLAIAHRAQMDPLAKECFMVQRRTKDQKTGEYTERFEFQPAELGMAARADRFADFGGVTSAPYYAKDSLTIDAAAGTVKHIYDPTKDRGPLMGAWAIVVRRGRALRVSDVKLSERIQPTPLWQKSPDTMIEKCARSEGYRIAYPNVFGGLYIEAEMPPALEEEREINPRPDDGKSRTERVMEKVTQRIAPTQQQVEAPRQPAAPIARFGGDGVKGKELRALTLQQLRELKAVAEGRLIKDPDASWAPPIRENLQQIDAELAQRTKLLDDVLAPTTPTSSRDPGADFDAGEPF